MFIAMAFAFIMAIVFAALGWLRSATVFWVTALIWLAYAGYEMQMVRRIWCTGECNIRVDLLLFYPVLLVVSVAAIVKAVRITGK